MQDKEILEDVVNKVLKELERAEVLHPIWPENIYKAYAILAEESGELSQAILQHDDEGKSFKNIEEEAVQTAAMAIRFLKNLKEKE